MKQQIIFIDGGTAKENYKDYIDYLKKLEFNPYKDKRKKWKYSLQEKLGDDFEVLFLPFGDRNFSYYPEWKIIFEKVFPYLKENVIFVGHSLGGSFLVKYFNEEKINFNFKKIYLLAPAFKDSENEVIGSFNFDKKLTNLQNISKKIIILHSKDDFVVSFSDFLDFQKVLSDSKFITFEDKNHFLNEEFCEFLEILKK